MKYHINNDDEAKPCGAQYEENCPFFGKNGGTNHFTSYEDAAQRLEQILVDRHNAFASSQKKLSPQFIQNRDFIKDTIDTYSDSDSLPNVYNTKDMIDKWFNGDRETYRKFKMLVSEKGFTSETRVSVAELLRKGIIVESSSSVHQVGKDSSVDGRDFSEITILDDTPDFVDINSLRRGELNAFFKNE